MAISHNRRIRYVPNELAAVVRFRVPLIIAIGHVPSAELARTFVASIERIETFLDAPAPPFIAKLYSPTPSKREESSTVTGRIELWYPAQLRRPSP